MIHSMEGVTQVDSLDIVAYDFGIIPRIKRPKSTYPDITQPQYADDYRALYMFNHLKKYFKALKSNYPAQGYLPIPLKAYWSCIRKTLKQDRDLADVTDLRCEQVHIIWGVKSGMKKPKVIG